MIDPLTHVLLSYVHPFIHFHSAFSGESNCEEKGESHSSGLGGSVVGQPSSSGNAWQLAAMSCLTRLTFMALAGHIDSSVGSSSTTSEGSNTNTFETSHSGKGDLSHLSRSTKSSLSDGHTTFPLPVIHCKQMSQSVHSPRRQNVKIGAVTDRSCGYGNDAEVLKDDITVVAIKFPKTQEVELLWLETTKTFADLTNLAPIEVSQRATYCLQASS